MNFLIKFKVKDKRLIRIVHSTCPCESAKRRKRGNKIQIKSKPEGKHNRIVVRAIFAKYLAGGIRGGKRGSRDAEWTK